MRFLILSTQITGLLMLLMAWKVEQLLPCIIMTDVCSCLAYKHSKHTISQAFRGNVPLHQLDCRHVVCCGEKFTYTMPMQGTY